MITSKEEMLRVLAKSAEKKKIELLYNEGYSFDSNFKALSLCDELSTEIEDLSGNVDSYSITVEFDSKDISDNELMFLVYKIKRNSDNDVGYIRFSGRYSSWDSSYYHLCEVVYPKKVTKTIYESKLDQDVSE